MDLILADKFSFLEKGEGEKLFVTYLTKCHNYEKYALQISHKNQVMSK